MAKFLGTVRKRPQGKYLKLFCEDCKSMWVAGRFPMSVSKVEKIMESKCLICESTNLSVFDDFLEETRE